MTNITYRPATQQDLPQIIAIYNQIISLHNVTADIYPVALIERQAWFEDIDHVHQAIDDEKLDLDYLGKHLM